MRNLLWGLGALAVLFVLQNARVVEVRFLFWTASASQALVLAVTAGRGMLAGWGLGRWRGRREGGKVLQLEEAQKFPS
jgi:uncharacterized integral membrane protein